MDFVKRERLLQPVGLPAAGHPGRIVPTDAIDVDHLRGGPRRHLGAEGEGIALLERRLIGADLVLVERPFAQPGDEQSQNPLGMCLRMGWRRPSQALKSPTTLTAVAFGAQTAKLTPSTLSIVRSARPGGCSTANAAPRSRGAGRSRSASAERSTDRASSFSCPLRRRSGAHSGPSRPFPARGKSPRTSRPGESAASAAPRRHGADRPPKPATIAAKMPAPPTPDAPTRSPHAGPKARRGFHAGLQ